MRKSKIRRQKRRKHQKWIGFAVLYLLTLCVVVWSGFQATNHLLNAAKFRVDHVAIQGVSNFNLDSVKERVEPFLGKNIFSMDLDAVRLAVADHPWVTEASIRRELPNKLRLKVDEQPIAGLLKQKNDIFVVTANGEVLESYRAKMGVLDVPLITGVKANERSKIMRSLHCLTELKEKHLFFWSHMNQLEWKGQVMIAHLDPFPSPIVLGETLYGENIQLFLKLADHIEITYPHIAYVELGFPGQVTIMPETES